LLTHQLLDEIMQMIWWIIYRRKKNSKLDH